MAGLAGFTLSGMDRDAAERRLRAMTGLSYDPRLAKLESSFCDDSVAVALAVPKAVETLNLAERDGSRIWLYGELYNRDELTAGRVPPQDSDAAAMLELYRSQPDWSWLDKADGDFSAVIWDARQHRVHLVADRFGMRFLYWGIVKGRLVWATHLGALVEAPSFQPTIDERAALEFLLLGYLLGERSWLEHVQLMPMSTVVTYDLTSETATSTRYWWWDRIRPVGGRVDEREAADELRRLFLDAVERRCRPGERLGVPLSGGLDSRAILAALPPRVDPVTAYTFGQRGSLDVAIAQRVAAVRGADHHVIELRHDNWLAPRLPGVWWTNGVLSLLHMHGIEAADLELSLVSVVLNGLGGDTQMRGDWLRGPKTWDTLDPVAIARMIGCEPALLSNIDDYAGLANGDYYLIPNRGRNAWNSGAPLTQTYLVSRYPFMDVKLVERLYSFPDALRADGGLYRRILVDGFPSYYRSIPWQHTGVPYSWPHLAEKVHGKAMRIEARFTHRVHAVGVKGFRQADYSAYDDWLRREPARGFFDALFRAPDALYPRYVPRSVVLKTWEGHLRGQRYAAHLGRYATMEIWLRQLLLGERRPGEQAEERRDPGLAAETVTGEPTADS